jgi:hypothetical protein
MVSSSHCPGCDLSYNLRHFQLVLLIAGALVLAGVLMGSLRAVMSSIMRWRRGLIVRVLMGNSFPD